MRGPWAVTLVLALSTVAPAQKALEWGPSPIGGDGSTGRVSALACLPTNPDILYAGTADGGVWKTTDGGASWWALTDSMPTTATGAIALDPTRPETVYVGTGEANFANHSRYGLGLLKSLDGGRSWTLLAQSVFAGRCFSKLAVDPANPQTVFAAITPAGGFPEKVAARGHPMANGPLGVFRSSDGGASWSHVAGGLPAEAATDFALDPSNSSVAFAAIGRIFGSSANGIYRSMDGGSTWSKLGGGLPTANVGRISLAIAPSQPSRIYALVTRAATAAGGGATTLGAYRSDDRGSTWTALPVGSIQSTYGWYLSVVSVHPSNPDTVFMGGLTLVRSTNAGASWSNVTPPHVDLHALAWDAAGRLLAGDDGGVHRSANLGSSWTAINQGLGAIQFYAGVSAHPTNSRMMLGGAQDNGSSRRNASGSWTAVLGGDGGWTQIDASNPQRMFAEFQGTGNLYLSSNGGASFSLSRTGISTGDRNCFLPPYEIDPTNPNRMLYGTHRLYESLNGGTNWTPVSADVTTGTGAIRSLAIARSNPDVVYVATNDGNVAVSFDRGRTFVQRASSMPGWPRVTRELCVHPNDANTVFLAVSAFGVDQIRRSTDAGATWQTLDGDLPDVPVNVIAVDPRTTPHTLYAGTDQGLFRSWDDGTTWHRIPRFPNVPVIDLRMEPTRSRLMVATQGRGAWVVLILILGLSSR